MFATLSQDEEPSLPPTYHRLVVAHPDQSAQRFSDPLSRDPGYYSIATQSVIPVANMVAACGTSWRASGSGLANNSEACQGQSAPQAILVLNILLLLLVILVILVVLVVLVMLARLVMPVMTLVGKSMESSMEAENAVSRALIAANTIPNALNVLTKAVGHPEWSDQTSADFAVGLLVEVSGQPLL